MATTPENLRTFLLADSSIANEVGSRIAYNIVPEDKGSPYIFFQQSGATDDIALDDSAGAPNRPQFVVECYAETPSRAIVIKNLVHARLHKYRGTFGDTTTRGIFAEDVSDAYIRNGDGGDEGLHASTINVEIVL